MSHASVAAIITCYNLGRTIEEAVDSVLHQTSRPEEILIVDDGSTDVLSRQALDRLERDGHRVIRSKNRGVCAARNLGIRSTTAPYIVLLDADDLLEPTYVEVASAMLNADPEVAFISCGMTCFGTASDVRTPLPPDVVDSMVQGVPHVSSMFRRAMWEVVGGFDESFDAHEEVDFWTRVLSNGFSGHVIDAPLLRYRIRSDSMYQSAVRPDRHRGLMTRFYRKHHEMITTHAAKLLGAKERFILDQRAHQRALIARKAATQIELGNLQREIDRTVVQLQALNRDRIEFGDLRRTSPISSCWGLDRGKPLDRHYIETFLDQHRDDIRGRVLEIKDSGYTRRYGEGRVVRADVLDIDPENQAATIVADLSKSSGVPAQSFDCVILTQTLGLIYDVRAALANVHRSLKPGGVLLCTVPASGRISYEGPALDGDFWRFTEASVRQLFAEVFPVDGFEVRVYGNVLARTAFLYGLAAHELSREELDALDPFFPVTYAIRAQRRPSSVIQLSNTSAEETAILMYHRIAHPGPDGAHMCVAPEHLRAHLVQLRADGYNVVSLAELRWGLEHKSLPPRSVAITLDDGYVDALTDAAGILRELGVPATVFVVGAATQRGYEFWWDVLDRVWTGGHILPSTLSIELAGEALTLPTETPRQRSEAHTRIRDAMYRLPMVDRDAAMSQLLSWSRLPRTTRASTRPLTESELIQLASIPDIEIGAHGENHLWLPLQPRPSVKQEVSASKHRLEQSIGRPVTSFAYPYGGYDAVSIEAVRQAGFTVAVTTEQRRIHAGDDPLTLPRFEIADCDQESFAQRLRRIFSESRRPALITAQPASRVLVAGWFSFEEGHATAGDLLARDLTCEWIRQTGRICDVATAHPFTDGVDWRAQDPDLYSHVVFVCGPFGDSSEVEGQLLRHFTRSRLVGLNLTMLHPVERSHPFHDLFERDSNAVVRPDMVFASPYSATPVVGVCLVEHYAGADTYRANRLIDQLTCEREMSVVRIDTRLDVNETGLRTAREIESVIARMDLVISTRLHGMVLALKHERPVVAIDPELGGMKIRRQAERLGWPIAFDVETLTADQLRQGFDYCLTTEARLQARRCRDLAVSGVERLRTEFTAALEQA